MDAAEIFTAETMIKFAMIWAASMPISSANIRVAPAMVTGVHLWEVIPGTYPGGIRFGEA